MSLKTYEIQKFIDSVDSKEPTPGGGSVAALIGSLGVSLCRMVGHLTVEKKKFLNLPEKEKSAFLSAMDFLIGIKENLKLMIDEDTNAYNQIISAYKLPNNTEVQIQARKKAIQEGTLASIQIPFRVVLLSLEAMEVLPIILKYGNKNAISDLGVSALSLNTSAQGAGMNVLINLPLLEDERLKGEYDEKIKVLLAEAKEKSDNIIKEVFSKLQLN